jgi:hypothetical protein
MAGERHAMRIPKAMALFCAVFGLAAGCGDDAEDAPAALPASGVAYRALSAGERLAVAAGCRDRAVAAASQVAADQLSRVDAWALRKQLDLALTLGANRRRAFPALCSQILPFVTPSVRVTFAGATDSGDAFTYQTRSDKPLTIRGMVSPARAGAYVVARREFGSSRPFRSDVGADGSFVMPTVRLRKVANNSFVVGIHSAPDALRKVRFSAICVDCLAVPPPPDSN